MKRLLTFLALVAFSAVSLAAVVRVVRTEWAGDRHFDRAAMEAWLTSTDAETHRFELVDASPQVRRAARMLERDFHDDYDWRPYFKALDDDARKRFLVNFEQLGRMLFEQRADRYAVMPSHARERYLDGQLADFAHWYTLGTDGKKVQGIEMFRAASAIDEAKLAELKLDRSPARLRADAEFLRDLQSHFLKKTLGRFLPGKTEKPKRDD